MRVYTVKTIIVASIVIVLTSCGTHYVQLPSEPEVETMSEGTTDIILNGINISRLKRHINEMDEIVSELSSSKYSLDSENSWIFQKYCQEDEEQCLPYHKIEVVKIIGEYDTFPKLCAAMEDYCTPNVVEVLLEKNFLNANDNGDIGILMSDGEAEYDYYDESCMEILSDEGGSAKILIRRFTEPDYSGFYRDVIYTFELNDSGNYIVTDICEQLESGEIVKMNGVW